MTSSIRNRQRHCSLHAYWVFYIQILVLTRHVANPRVFHLFLFDHAISTDCYYQKNVKELLVISSDFNQTYQRNLSVSYTHRIWHETATFLPLRLFARQHPALVILERLDACSLKAGCNFIREYINISSHCNTHISLSRLEQCWINSISRYTE